MLFSSALTLLPVDCVDMDGGWNSFKSLNKTGYLTAERIPELEGRVLAAALHAKGCKLGMYVTGGSRACTSTRRSGRRRCSARASGTRTA